jgi:drug/metabolite transporter (DMT)-like permease
MPDLMHSKWTVPGASVLVGLVYLGSEIIGGHPWLGVQMFGIMAVFGAAVLLGGRSETIRGLRGDGRDERFAMLDLRATAFTAVVIILAILAAFSFEVAHGRSGMQYAWLGAVGGLTYLASVIYLRIRG